MKGQSTKDKIFVMAGWRFSGTVRVWGISHTAHIATGIPSTKHEYPPSGSGTKTPVSFITPSCHNPTSLANAIEPVGHTDEEAAVGDGDAGAHHAVASRQSALAAKVGGVQQLKGV